jgi:signal transduction histidine kinase
MSVPGSFLNQRLPLSDLLDLRAFGEVCHSFAELYRVGLKVFDEAGNKLVDVKVGNADFCGYIWSKPAGREACIATVGRVKSDPIGEESTPSTVQCFSGCRYVVQPILYEGDVMGRVVFGPFMPEDLPVFPPQSLTEISEGIDVANATKLVEKVRRAPESTIARIMLHFGQLLQTMLFAGQKMFLTSQLHIEATLEQNRELEERNKKLEEANHKLKELDRLKSAFLATVSHELRTPLTSIIGYSEMLAEGLAGPMNDEQVDYVRTIMEKGETLLKLISSILDISQIEAGKVRLNFEPMDAVDLVTSSVSSLKPQAQKKGVVLEAKVPNKMPKVNGDRDRLRQVVVNLLANAVKFTPKGGRVSVTLSEIAHQPDLNSDGFRLIIEDSGVGIPTDQFDKVFNSFYQVDSSSTREYGGAGLGLAIVKSFVEGHGGVVRLASELGHGSRFTLILPVVPSLHPNVQITPPVTALQAPADDRF